MPRGTFVYALVRNAAGLSVDLFYRRSVFGGPVPGRGPVLLVANHPNGLIDPAEVMQLTRRRVRFLAKAPLFSSPVLGGILRSMGTLPVYRASDGADTARNEDTFRAVHEALAAGELVCLFPEGRSHSEPALQKLKTGAARMALGAEASVTKPLGVRVVPVGLLHAKKSRFRSRAAAWIGEPIEVGDLLDAKDEREAVVALTERISLGLRQVMIELDDWCDLPPIQLAERMWPANEANRVERLRELALGLRRLREHEPSRADDLVRRVAEFGDRLDCLGLTVGDLDLSYTRSGVLRFVARNAFLCLVALPLFLLGALFWWLPNRLVGRLARIRTVSTDIVATQKVISGMVVFALWYAAGILVALRLGGPVAALLTAGVTPGLGVLTLQFGDRFRAARVDAATFFRFRGAAGLKERLARRRDELLSELREVYERLSAAGVPTGGE